MEFLVVLDPADCGAGINCTWINGFSNPLFVRGSDFTSPCGFENPSFRLPSVSSSPHFSFSHTINSIFIHLSILSSLNGKLLFEIWWMDKWDFFFSFLNRLSWQSNNKLVILWRRNVFLSHACAYIDVYGEGRLQTRIVLSSRSSLVFIPVSQVCFADKARLITMIDHSRITLRSCVTGHSHGKQPYVFVNRSENWPTSRPRNYLQLSVTLCRGRVIAIKHSIIGWK